MAAGVGAPPMSEPENACCFEATLLLSSWTTLRPASLEILLKPRSTLADTTTTLTTTRLRSHQHCRLRRAGCRSDPLPLCMWRDDSCWCGQERDGHVPEYGMRSQTAFGDLDLTR